MADKLFAWGGLPAGTRRKRGGAMVLPPGTTLEDGCLLAPTKQRSLDRALRDAYVALEELPRDGLGHDHQIDLAVRLVKRFPRELLKELGEHATREPYCAHVLFAALQLDDPPIDLDPYRDQLRLTEPIPRPRARRLQQTIDEYGHPTVTATLAWLRSEFAARNVTYKTAGLFLTSNLLRNCAHFRDVLDSRIKAPRHWESATAHLVECQALKARYYVMSKGRKFPVFSF